MACGFGIWQGATLRRKTDASLHRGTIFHTKLGLGIKPSCKINGDFGFFILLWPDHNSCADYGS